MTKDEGDSLTHEAYLNPKVVAGYVAEHARNPKLTSTLEHFASLVPGKRILDVGMGPGHDSWHLANLGFEVVGFDFSPEMVQAAESLHQGPNKPTFLEGDMTQMTKMFPENSFDGAWVSASLLHIARERVPEVLRGLGRITVSEGIVYFGLKKGDRDEIREETKYGPVMKRKFILWQKESFERQLNDAGFKVTEFREEVKGDTWLNFFAKNIKF